MYIDKEVFIKTCLATKENNSTVANTFSKQPIVIFTYICVEVAYYVSVILWESVANSSDMNAMIHL